MSGLRQAIIHACGANAAHGVRHSNEDKRYAVGLDLAGRAVARCDARP